MSPCPWDAKRELKRKKLRVNLGFNSSVILNRLASLFEKVIFVLFGVGALLRFNKDLKKLLSLGNRMN